MFALQSFHGIHVKDKTCIYFFLVIAFFPTKTGKNAGELAKMSTIFCLYCAYSTQSGRPMHTTLGLYCPPPRNQNNIYGLLSIKGILHDSY